MLRISAWSNFPIVQESSLWNKFSWCVAHSFLQIGQTLKVMIHIFIESCTFSSNSSTSLIATLSYSRISFILFATLQALHSISVAVWHLVWFSRCIFSLHLDYFIFFMCIHNLSLECALTTCTSIKQVLSLSTSRDVSFLHLVVKCFSL